MTKRNKTILQLAIIAMILLAGLLTITGCDPSESAAVRERIAINANADSYVRNGYDFYFYSDDRSTQKILLEGSAGNVDAEGTLDVEGNTDLNGTLNVEGAAMFQGTIGVTGEVTFTGGIQTAYITATTSITSPDITASDDVVVFDTLDVNGDIDLDGDGFDVDVSAGASIDAGGATNLSASAGDITIEAETGSLILKGDEAVADAITLDANDAAGGGITMAVGSSGGLTILGGLTDIGMGSYATANGDNDLGVAGDLEVDGDCDFDGSVLVADDVTVTDVGTFAGATSGYITATTAITGLDISTGDDMIVFDTLDVNGDIDLDGDGFDVDITAGASIDADGAINVSASTGDILIDGEAGSVTIIGSEAAADSVSIDANDTVTSGLTIVVGSVGGLQIDGGLVDIGSGTYATANGDNDLGIAGDLEVDGATDLDGALSVATTSGLVGNVTASAVVSIGSWARFAEQTPIAVTDGGVLTATGTYQPITSAGTVTPTISTSGFTAGDLLIVTNESATSIVFADSGTLMLNTARTIGQYDVLGLLFDGTNWLELWFNNN